MKCGAPQVPSPATDQEPRARGFATATPYRTGSCRFPRWGSNGVSGERGERGERDEESSPLVFLGSVGAPARVLEEVGVCLLAVWKNLEAATNAHRLRRRGRSVPIRRTFSSSRLNVRLLHRPFFNVRLLHRPFFDVAALRHHLVLLLLHRVTRLVARLVAARLVTRLVAPRWSRANPRPRPPTCRIDEHCPPTELTSESASEAMGRNLTDLEAFVLHHSYLSTHATTTTLLYPTYN